MNNAFFKPYPVIKSDRLELKMISYKDVKDVFAIYSDDDVCRYSDIVKHKNVFHSLEYIFYSKRKFYNNACLTFGVYLKSTGRLIGTVSITEIASDYTAAEIGYSFNKNYRQKYYGSEAVKAFCEYLFKNTPVKTITAKTMVENIASKKLLIKNGFVFLGLVKNGGQRHGQMIDVNMFELKG